MKQSEMVDPGIECIKSNMSKEDGFLSTWYILNMTQYGVVELMAYGVKLLSAGSKRDCGKVV